MKIVYNPPIWQGGSHIYDFNPGGKKMEPHPAGQLRQYSDIDAEKLKETFPFVRFVGVKEAEEIASKPLEGKYKCEYCDFTTDTPVALSGHKRKHASEIVSEDTPVFDTNKIPIAESTPIKGRFISEYGLKEKDIPNGVDSEGVVWYGEGVKESNRSAMRGINSIKSGNFKGGL
jgi:hypothetical protein